MQSPPLKNDISCCLVLDSSALMDDEYDAVKLLRELLPNSPHTIVIPIDVLEELQGLTNATATVTATQAESILAALAVYPDFAPRRAPAHPPSSASPSEKPAAACTHGVAVRQRPKETFYPLMMFAGNRDTKIIACAHYFTDINRQPADHDSSSTKAVTTFPRTTSGSQRHQRYASVFFVTNDVVQQIKASPYSIRIISTSDLSRHWGHLGYWEA